MSTAHIIQTVIEIIVMIALIIGLIYEPILAKWEDKQKEKVLKAFKEMRRYRR